MSAAWSMSLATFFFASMGVCVKLASERYGAGELVFYRSVIGVVVMAALMRWRGIAFRTRVPAMHVGRNVSGVTSLCLWFYTLGHLQLATAVTLNYMSSIWMALFVVAGAAWARRAARVDARLVATVALGFIGVALVLRPTVDRSHLWYGFLGLLSGMIAATAYLQMAALGRAGEPDDRVVFYFASCGTLAGAALSWEAGWHPLDWGSAALLLGIGLMATFAQLLMTRAYRTGRVLVNASLQYLAIGYSFVYGIALFGDQVTWWSVAGMACIVAAGLAATLLRSSPPPGPPVRVTKL